MCPICLDFKIVERRSRNGSVRELVTCPACVRHVSVLGPHERLRSRGGIDLPTGTRLWKIEGGEWNAIQ